MSTTTDKPEKTPIEEVAREAEADQPRNPHGREDLHRDVEKDKKEARIEAEIDSDEPRAA